MHLRYILKIKYTLRCFNVDIVIGAGEKKMNHSSFGVQLPGETNSQLIVRSDILMLQAKSWDITEEVLYDLVLEECPGREELRKACNI